MTPAVPVRVSYAQLRHQPDSCSLAIEEAFGASEGSLGIIVVEDLPPEYSTLRSLLFHLIHRLANLPPDERDKLAKPETSYLFGWSHGKEVMNGKPDTQKGSFYVNPLLDVPDVSDEKRRAHPEYYSGNVWPRDIQGLEEFASTCKALGRLVYEVGLALAKACQPFAPPPDKVVQASLQSTDSTSSTSSRNVESLISRSQSNKARLLHYYPESSTTGQARVDDQLAEDSLCGTHVDHSLLTGLCSAMYLKDRGLSGPVEVAAPTSTSGLYIYPRGTRKGGTEQEAVKVSIPPDCLAFQIGEALELLTGGQLAATPHFVSGSSGAVGRVSRETFAFFLQPDVDDIIGSDGETFGDFTKRVLGRHYSSADLVEEAEI